MVGRGQTVDESGESAELQYEPCDDRLEIARRLYRAMCAQYPDRLITLCNGDGRIVDGQLALKDTPFK
jgi:hypothetical protein